MRLSFLGYRDHCDDASDQHFSILKFTKKQKDFQNFVGSVKAAGVGIPQKT
eukprot:TRINITY_DN2362_c0_g1_i1.p2 TRINITY_DN2362_c0_g1~~TRINITY_DN2362_c0_g1_i1.p2  ORF type:complete len:51 (-),score=6.03 TRINITY_DN2362_c0_g1_i1:241-393(-)